MNIWSTFRAVPPISPEAMAWAVASFATYLGAIAYTPSLWGRTLDPLSLAFAVQLTLSVTKNMTSDKFRRAAIASPIITTIQLMIFVGCMGALAIFGTSTTTANIVIVYFAQHGVLLATAATKYPKWINMLQGTWNEGTRFDIPATMGRGLGAALKALTLFTVWHFAGPTAFAAMMSFGVLVLHVLCDWAIVLYLIDLQQRAQDD